MANDRTVSAAAIEALQAALDALARDLEAMDEWRALRQLDERERAGDPLGAMDGIVLRGRLVGMLERTSPIWRARVKIERVMAELRDGESVADALQAPESEAGPQVVASPMAPLVERMRVKVRAGSVLLPGRGAETRAGSDARQSETGERAAPESVPQVADGGEVARPRPATPVQDILGRIRPVTAVAAGAGEASDRGAPQSTAIWGSRATPAPEPEVEIVVVGEQPRQPVPRPAAIPPAPVARSAPPPPKAAVPVPLSAKASAPAAVATIAQTTGGETASGEVPAGDPAQLPPVEDNLAPLDDPLLRAWTKPLAAIEGARRDRPAVAGMPFAAAAEIGPNDEAVVEIVVATGVSSASDAGGDVRDEAAAGSPTGAAEADPKSATRPKDHPPAGDEAERAGPVLDVEEASVEIIVREEAPKRASA
jgi:hypothetical protein